MNLTDLIISQITDPFRLALLAGLALTASRTAPVNGVIVPLIAGSVFVAAIIPLVLKPAGDQMLLQVGLGIAVNGLILAVGFGLWVLWRRMRP